MNTTVKARATLDNGLVVEVDASVVWSRYVARAKIREQLIARIETKTPNASPVLKPEGLAGWSDKLK